MNIAPLPTIEYRCTDGCKTAVTLPADQYPPGWTLLQITNRWRCPACANALAVVAPLGGVDVSL